MINPKLAPLLQLLAFFQDALLLLLNQVPAAPQARPRKKDLFQLVVSKVGSRVCRSHE
jgi:hypothetical protein